MFFVGKREKDLGVKKRSLARRILFGPNAIRVVVLVLLAAFSLFYLSQSSQSATRNYMISDLEKQNSDMTAEKERLEVEANRLKALSLIQDKANQMGMQQVSQ
jgi:cell division protein FtsL